LFAKPALFLLNAAIAGLYIYISSRNRPR